MARLAARKSSSTLVARLLSEPDLPAQLARLSGQQLKVLVARVGIDDASEILGMLPSSRLLALLDEELWRPLGEHGDEFDRDRFIHLLEVMAEGGVVPLAHQLSTLSEDFLTFALSELIVVFPEAVMFSEAREEDGDQVEKKLESQLYEELGDSFVIARDAEAWDTIWPLLLELAESHGALLDRLLSRLGHLGELEIDEAGGVSQILDDLMAMREEAEGSREERRARLGYVSGPDARAFLALPPIDAPASDAISRAHFRRLAPADESPSFHVLSGTLKELLPAPSTEAPQLPGLTPLTRAMLALERETPERHARLLDELAFLVNVVTSAARSAGEELHPEVALTRVRLRLDQMLLELGADPAQSLDEWGAISLFRKRSTMETNGSANFGRFPG